MHTALRELIRLIVSEGTDDVRFPNQLVSPDAEKQIDHGNRDREEAEDEDENRVREFSACGGGSIAGFTAPLGTPKRKKK